MEVIYKRHNLTPSLKVLCGVTSVAYRGGGVWGGSNPSKIPKALQNRAKLNSIVKTVKNC